jgi:hypothetical protein
VRRRTAVTAAVVAALISAFAVTTAGARTDARSSASSASSCRLGNGIKHVIYIQFDNTHLDRDIPNVPSDL